MNKFCSILAVIILGVVNVSGCCCDLCGSNEKNKSNNKTKIQGGEPDLGAKKGEELDIKGEGGEEEQGGEGEEDKKRKEEEGKTKVINGIKGYINDKNMYPTKNLNEFNAKINESNKVVITLDGGHFTATSVNDWNKIGNYQEAVFTISVKTNNNEKGLYWKFKDNNEITLENLRNSLAKIGDKYRENCHSHYLCVKDKNGKLQDGRACFIDLSSGVIWVCTIGDDKVLRMTVCDVVTCRNGNEYPYTFNTGYFNGEYHILNSQCEKITKHYFNGCFSSKACIPTEGFMNKIGELDIVCT